MTDRLEISQVCYEHFAHFGEIPFPNMPSDVNKQQKMSNPRPNIDTRTLSWFMNETVLRLVVAMASMFDQSAMVSPANPALKFLNFRKVPPPEEGLF